MMADRFCTLFESIGYAGTDSEEDVDVLDWLNITEKELAKMTNDEVEEELCEYGWEQATQKIDEIIGIIKSC